MSVNNCKYHELMATVPNALLKQYGYPVKEDCNRNGPTDALGNIIKYGDRIVFGSKCHLLESVFDAYVVVKNRTSKWAKTRVESSAWRT